MLGATKGVEPLVVLKRKKASDSRSSPSAPMAARASAPASAPPVPRSSQAATKMNEIHCPSTHSTAECRTIQRTKTIFFRKAGHAGGNNATGSNVDGDRAVIVAATLARHLAAVELGAAYQVVVGACIPASVLAFPTKLVPLRASLCIDTGSSVNLIDFDCYSALRRESRGGRYALRPSDLTLTGVAADRLDMHGIVRLPISFGKYSCRYALTFMSWPD